MPVVSGSRFQNDTRFKVTVSQPRIQPVSTAAAENQSAVSQKEATVKPEPTSNTPQNEAKTVKKVELTAAQSARQKELKTAIDFGESLTPLKAAQLGLDFDAEQQSLNDVRAKYNLLQSTIEAEQSYYDYGVDIPKDVKQAIESNKSVVTSKASPFITLSSEGDYSVDVVQALQAGISPATLYNVGVQPGDVIKAREYIGQDKRFKKAAAAQNKIEKADESQGRYLYDSTPESFMITPSGVQPLNEYLNSRGVYVPDRVKTPSQSEFEKMLTPAQQNTFIRYVNNRSSLGKQLSLSDLSSADKQKTLEYFMTTKLYQGWTKEQIYQQAVAEGKADVVSMIPGLGTFYYIRSLGNPVQQSMTTGEAIKKSAIGGLSVAGDVLFFYPVLRAGGTVVKDIAILPRQMAWGTQLSITRNGVVRATINVFTSEASGSIADIYKIHKIEDIIYSEQGGTLLTGSKGQFERDLASISKAQIKAEQIATRPGYRNAGDIVKTEQPWRTITVTQPNGKTYAYFVPRDEELYQFKQVLNGEDLPAVWGSRRNVTTKTKLDLEVERVTGRSGVVGESGASAGLATEERLGAMTPEQAAKYSDYQIRTVYMPQVIRTVQDAGIPSHDGQTIVTTIQKAVTSTTPITTSQQTITPAQMVNISAVVKAAADAAQSTRIKASNQNITGSKADDAVKEAVETAVNQSVRQQVKTATETAISRSTKVSSSGKVASFYNQPNLKKRVEDLTPEEKEASVTWKQGIGWWVLIPPKYDDATSIFSIKQPDGIKVSSDMTTARATLQKIKGVKVPDKIKFNRLGAFSAVISKPPARPSANGQINFLRNKKVGGYYVAGNSISRKPIGKRKKNDNNGYGPIYEV